MRITPQQFESLKLKLKGASAYEIARKLGKNPPSVYHSLKVAERNFWVAKLMLKELEVVGFSEKIPPPKDDPKDLTLNRQKAERR